MSSRPDACAIDVQGLNKRFGDKRVVVDFSDRVMRGDKIGFMVALGAWNFVIGFALIVVGLLMTMRWR